ncbi:MAG: S9 family peptidase [Gemmatimonadota bacterium]|nr:S9 family peptidase [Gemmatimonadota bacterium]
MILRAFAAVAAAVTLAAAPALLGAQRADPRADRLTLADYLEFEGVADPQLSPDGASIIYTRTWIDKLNDKRMSSIYIMNADGSKPRKLVDGNSPSWSPDGSRIAYTAEGEPNNTTQIFTRYMDAEGAVTQVTRLTSSPANVRWSPDGRTLAFTTQVPKNTPAPKAEGQATQYRPRGANWTAAPRVVQSLDYRQDRMGFLPDATQQLFTVPADGGTPRQVTSGEWSAAAGVWTPDGTALIYASGPRVPDAEYEWRESEVFAVDVASGTITQLTTRKGPDGNPAISPDGKRIAYTGYDFTTDTWVDSKLYLMNRDGSGARLLLDMDRSPQDLDWAKDGGGIYFTAQSEGAQNLYFVDLNGRSRKVTDGKQMLSVSDIHANGLAVGTLTTASAPGDVVSFSLKAPSQMRQLTDVNGDVLAGKTLGAVEEVWYTSLDDYRIQGWIVKPPDFDPSKKYPLMLSIHGGPHSMYNVGFNFAFQEHASNGYVVLYLNPRGSTGYGSKFGNAIKNAYPSKDYDDLMKGVDQVIAKGYIDTDNLFVYGCSGGGVLTAWTVGHTDRFAAASANCPVIDWISFVGNTDGPNWYRNFEKLPWEDPSEHLKRSPLMYVGNVKTPTMLMTGVNDLRTPIGQTEEFYEALKIQKVPTQMVRFVDEWHGTSSKPSNFIRTQLYLREWFKQFARGAMKPVTQDR